MLIGEKIRLLRKNKKITQAELAEALSVSSQSVSKWENHISVPDISVLPSHDSSRDSLDLTNSKSFSISAEGFFESNETTKRNRKSMTLF